MHSHSFLHPLIHSISRLHVVPWTPPTKFKPIIAMGRLDRAFIPAHPMSIVGKLPFFLALKLSEILMLFSIVTVYFGKSILKIIKWAEFKIHKFW